MNRLLRLARLVSISFSATVLIFGQPRLSMAMEADFDPVPLQMAQNINFDRHFQDLGVEGSILISDLNGDRIFERNPERNRTAFPTASTFKILNSLIALETGVISNELAVLTWDGIERSIPEWNRDLNLKEAFRLSAVWFYQVLARRVGYDRMQEWVKKSGYGNQQIGQPEDIDRFWLNGTLTITPQQTIEFLQRLYRNDLPFSERSLSIVKEIAIVEKTPDYTIRGKTGWFGYGNYESPNIGWYVGYIEKGENVYFFASNIDIKRPEDGAARLELVRRCFQDLGVL